MQITEKIFPIVQFAITLFLIAVSLSLIMLLNYKIDYMGWHSPSLTSDNIPARTYNAVIAKTMKYNAVILGSSLSQNFRCSELDKIQNVQSLKMPFESAHISELLFTLRYANQFQKIDLVLFDLNFSMFLRKDPAVPIPERIYQLGRMETLQLLKFSTCYKSLVYLFKNYILGKRGSISRDELYSWDKMLPTGEQILAKRLFTIDPGKDPQVIFPITEQTMANAQYNVRTYLLPLLEENQDKKIFLFFPPYMMLAYENFPLEDIISLKKYLAETILQYPNVRLYDFQTAIEITENPDNYKDKVHYGTSINSWMLEQTTKDEYLLTQNNLDSKINSFKELISSFDYQQLWLYLRKIFTAVP